MFEKLPDIVTGKVIYLGNAVSNIVIFVFF